MVVWHIYILKCADGTLYTGITNNLQKRIKQHNAGKGAKYTRGRTPVELLKSFRRDSKGEALKLEHKIKKLSKADKLSYIDSMSKDIDCLFRWLQIREENGISFPNNLTQLGVDVGHSALLRRLLEGKEPLPIAPPCTHSYPWYELIEDGYGYPMEVWEAPEGFFSTEYQTLIIDQCACWKVLEKISDNSWIATYSYHDQGETKWYPGRWHIFQIGSRIPQNPANGSFNKLWKIERVD